MEKKNLHNAIIMLPDAYRDKKTHSYFVLIICKLERNQIFARVEDQGEWNLDFKVKINWVQEKSLISFWSIWDGFMEDVGFEEFSAEQRDMEGVNGRQKDSPGSPVESKIFLHKYVLHSNIK